MKTIITFSNGKRWASRMNHTELLEYAKIYASTFMVSFHYSVEAQAASETLISDLWQCTICLN